MELITGRKIKRLTVRDFLPEETPPREPQFAMEYSRQEVNLKEDSLTFYAYGVLNTADGRRINFNLTLFLKNFEIKIESEKLRSGSVALVDPLVINLNNTPNLFEPGYFSFDLQGDGIPEKVPFLSSGKGYLFFDHNDNDVPEAKELIGVKTGDAFEELKLLDQDNNRWIDWSDPAFGKIKVWLRTPTSSRVKTLKEVGVGALYTQDKPVKFPLSGSVVLGQLGVFLKENGQVGTLLKIDLRA
ncbi:MAG: hypothetical protein GXO18_00100 [Aquificae bacterium]|nr:hypothetical protein [Aquificota bacterium]